MSVEIIYSTLYKRSYRGLRNNEGLYMSTASEHYLTESYHLSIEKKNGDDVIQYAGSMNHDNWHSIFSCTNQGYYSFVAIC